MPYWPAQDDRIVELLQLGPTLRDAHFTSGGGVDLLLSLVAMHVQALLRLAYVGAIETCDRHTHVLGHPRLGLVAPEQNPLLLAADAHRLLLGRFRARTF